MINLKFFQFSSSNLLPSIKSLIQHSEDVHLSDSEKRLKISGRKTKKIQKKISSINPKIIKFVKVSFSDSTIRPYPEKSEEIRKKIKESRESDFDIYTRGR